MPGGGCYSPSPEKDSNPAQTAVQVIVLALWLLELYSNCEVRSLEKISRRQPQIAVCSAIFSTLILQEGLSLLRFWGWSTKLDARSPMSMVEGEELASNLLLWGIQGGLGVLRKMGTCRGTISAHPGSGSRFCPRPAGLASAASGRRSDRMHRLRRVLRLLRGSGVEFRLSWSSRAQSRLELGQ